MKRLGALAVALLLLGGCVHNKNGFNSREKEKVVSLGEMAVKRLMSQLKTNLGIALKEGGFAKAVDFCAGKAQELTDKVNKELVVVKVSRLSDKYRNPKDRATGEDLKVIEELKERLKEGKLPKYVIKKEGSYYVYYKPIIVAPFCLNCHGDPTKMSPEVLKVLKEKYPEDKALGYEAGQLRGVFKVVIPEKAVKGG